MRILILLSLFSLVSCQSPRDRRKIPLASSSTVTSPPSNDTGNDSGGSGSGNGNNNGGSGNESGGNGQTNPGYDHCSFMNQGNYQYYNIKVAYFSLCQNAQDQTQFWFKASPTYPGSRICIIPTYRDGQGASFYLGSAQCEFFSPGQLIQGTLTKNRSGMSSQGIAFQELPLNGVMVMPENQVMSYFDCMDASNAYKDQFCLPFIYNSAYLDIAL
jgi:hypothetical protein